MPHAFKSFCRVSLVGHDWGAFAAWYLASVAPDRITKLAVLSVGHTASFFPAGGLEQRQKSWYMMLFMHPGAEELLTRDRWALWRNIIGDPGRDYASTQLRQVSRPGALTAGELGK